MVIVSFQQMKIKKYVSVRMDGVDSLVIFVFVIHPVVPTVIVAMMPPAFVILHGKDLCVMFRRVLIIVVDQNKVIACHTAMDYHTHVPVRRRTKVRTVCIESVPRVQRDMFVVHVVSVRMAYVYVSLG